ncbi:S8 family serine peptidase [Micromonospora eburnea]|uniref:Serine protease, subtilisin family n=1 Tax=Micromonospora eburnea TaxID=227316 RepID=A0A1C6UT56_9ACTN|nr:S8 family serine peptidase [Micromonospora eburnea]SCL57222.1 Serine protease, subtilisin family [Micromonospora eburnea]
MRSSRSRRALLAGGIAVALLTAAPGTAGARQAAAPQAVRAATATAKAQTVTLITGDRVTVFGDGRLSVTPRKGVTYHSYRTEDHRYVIPSDAVPLLRADRLDRRLFDLTELLAAQATRPSSLGLVVSGTATAPGLSAQRRLPAVRGFAAEAATETLASRWEATRTGLKAGKIWLDAVRRPALDQSVPLIGAPEAWSAGFDGAGVRVAVLDTGIDVAHPDLAGKVSARQNFTDGEEDDRDHVGHGTHVASTIAGSGAASDGRYRGVAPGASLLDGKVCAEFGCLESWIVAGMQWAAESGADVVNMSLGGPNTPEVDPLEEAVNALTAQHGTLFVIAAGNDGGDETVGSPATAEAALAVAAFTKSDELADFSSRGPSADGWAVKPEIAAPGVDIVAARSKDGFLGEPGQLYMPLDGTSMATPHVAGAAALLSQAHPQWNAAQLKAALMASAKPSSGVGVFAQGAGRVDVARAVTQQVTTTPTSVTFGMQDWPHDEDEVRSDVVTYHNGGSAAVTLRLALTTDAPAGIFSLSADTVTVPAGGQASVTLTADTRAGGDVTGGLGGQVTATAAGVSVQTPFGVVRDELKHAVKVIATEHDGDPAENALTVIMRKDRSREYVAFGPTNDLRLPPGEYFAFTWVDEQVGDTFRTSQLLYPKLTVSGPQTVSMDARGAKGFDVTIPEPDAVPLLVSYDATYTDSENSSQGVGVLAMDFASIFTKLVGPKPTKGLSSQLTATLAKVNENDNPASSPYVYNVGWHSKNDLLGGLVKHLRPKDFATVTAAHAAVVPGSNGVKLAFLTPSDTPGGGWAVGWPTPLPFTRTEFYAGDAPWQNEFMAELPAEGDEWAETLSDHGAPATYRAGKTYQEQWNQGVFGPSVAPMFPGDMPALREGDTMSLVPGLLGDGQGRAGFGQYTSGHGAVYRDGKLIAESTRGPQVYAEDVDPAAATFRFDGSLERDARLSTRVSVSWTFRSAHTAEPRALPLTAVSFAPPLDEHNVGRAGGVGVYPATITQTAGSGPLVKLTVQVSYDDGKSWRKVPVLKHAGSWQVQVPHPAAGGFVSLRASGTDAKGNTFDQTVIRAYELR